MFSAAPVNRLFIHGSNNWDSVVFHNEGFEDIKDHSFRATPFQKKICYGSFEFVSTFHKKVFSGAQVKCLFLYGSNNSDCAIFGNAAFGEINDRSLRTTPFQTKICHGSCEFVSTLHKEVFSGAPVKWLFLYGLNKKFLSLCLPYVKRYFQEHQLSAFFFMAQITQIVLFSGMLLFGEIKNHSSRVKWSSLGQLHSKTQILNP